MCKRVVVIASGETEKRSLPHLLDHLKEENIEIIDIRYPPQHRDLRVDTIERLIKAAWYEYQYDERPDKFVVLKDVDGKRPQEVLNSLRQLPSRLRQQITIPICFAYAQWHLEAWFFGDRNNLQQYLGRSVGTIDASMPDQIENPKSKLKGLLGKVTYTSGISEDIARKLRAQTIAGRSPSFNLFLAAVRNGQG